MNERNFNNNLFTFHAGKLPVWVRLVNYAGIMEYST